MILIIYKSILRIEPFDFSVMYKKFPFTAKPEISAPLVEIVDVNSPAEFNTNILPSFVLYLVS
jgi:hypothetical protein